MSNVFHYGIDNLTTSKAIAVASGEIKASLGREARKKIQACQQYIVDIVNNNKTVYGINTGFGILANTRISAEDTATLQHKLLESHSVGVGDPVSKEIVRLMLVCKIHVLARGFSGVHSTTLERIIWHLEND